MLHVKYLSMLREKRARKDIWIAFRGRNGKDKRCNYNIISKSKRHKKRI